MKITADRITDALGIVQWEYILIRQEEVRNLVGQTVAEFLNKQGTFGWELCGIDYGCFIMKRRKA